MAVKGNDVSTTEVLNEVWLVIECQGYRDTARADIAPGMAAESCRTGMPAEGLLYMRRIRGATTPSDISSSHLLQPLRSRHSQGRATRMQP